MRRFCLYALAGCVIAIGVCSWICQTISRKARKDALIAERLDRHSGGMTTFSWKPLAPLWFYRVFTCLDRQASPTPDVIDKIWTGLATDVDLRMISECSSLRGVYVSGAFSDEAIRSLGGIPTLRLIDLQVLARPIGGDSDGIMVYTDEDSRQLRSFLMKSNPKCVVTYHPIRLVRGSSKHARSSDTADDEW